MLGLTLRVQVPNSSLQNHCPKPECLINRSFGPLPLPSEDSYFKAFGPKDPIIYDAKG